MAPVHETPEPINKAYFAEVPLVLVHLFHIEFIRQASIVLQRLSIVRSFEEVRLIGVFVQETEGTP